MERGGVPSREQRKVDWQSIIASGIVVLAATWLCWRMWRVARGRRSGGCGSCAANTIKATPLVQLGKKPKS